jgi:hypothetical protein
MSFPKLIGNRAWIFNSGATAKDSAA